MGREGFVEYGPLTDPDETEHDGQSVSRGSIRRQDETAGDRDGNRLINGVRRQHSDSSDRSDPSDTGEHRWFLRLVPQRITNMFAGLAGRDAQSQVRREHFSDWYAEYSIHNDTVRRCGFWRRSNQWRDHWPGDQVRLILDQ